MNKPSKNGFTIAEMLISLVIVGVSAALLAPKVLTTQDETARQAITLRVDAQKYQVASDIKMFQNQYNLSNDDLWGKLRDAGTTVTFPNIYSMYGNYFAYKNAGTTAAPINYYFLLDRSKISFNKSFFKSGYTGSVYPAMTTAFSNKLNALCVISGVNYCFYLDVNGPANPNTFGKTGDIVPMFIDPDSYDVSTLYEATNDCAVYSQYDELVHKYDDNGNPSGC